MISDKSELSLIWPEYLPAFFNISDTVTVSTLPSDFAFTYTDSCFSMDFTLPDPVSFLSLSFFLSTLAYIFLLSSVFLAFAGRLLKTKQPANPTHNPPFAVILI